MKRVTTKQNFDVVIVGAGPAGLCCAEEFTNTGLSVLIIDKKEEIGPKACAGGITHLACKYSLPDEITRSFRKQIVYLNKKTIKINLSHPLQTVSREDLSKHQLFHLKEADNITLLHPVKLKEILKNQVVTSLGVFGFKYLVGADGSVSTLRKHLGLKSKFCVGIYVEIPEVQNDFTWHVSPKTLKSAYFWTFPHTDHTNTGFYYNPKYFNSAQAREILTQHLLSRNVDIDNLKFHAGVVNYQYSGHTFGNIFLIGDAAGLAIQGSGEGISAALVSGREVAKYIHNSEYSMPELLHLIKIKNRQEKMLGIYERHPKWQNFLYHIFLLAMKNKGFQRWFGN